jgi:S1-C subfamily serine protease
MTQPTEPPLRKPGSETRLLLITIAVAGLALLLLARFRFPSETRPEPVPRPLERLVARATFADLADTVGVLQPRIAPSLAVLRVHAYSEGHPASVQELIGPQSAVANLRRYVVGIRVRPDVVLTLLEPGTHVQAVVGSDQAPVVLATDPLRGLALVRIPPVPAESVWQWEEGSLGDPAYVVLVEGTAAGPTLRPFFVGRAVGFNDPKWERPLMVLGNAAPGTSGALVFTLEGRFVGMSMANDEGLMTAAPAGMLAQATDRLFEAGSRPLGDIGVMVQSLTPGLAAATGADSGVVITAIAPGSDAAGALQVGDVVAAVNGEPTSSPEGFLVKISQAGPGSTVSLRVVRRGAAVEASVPVRPLSPTAPQGSGELGLDLRLVRGTGSEVMAVAPRSAAARAGLRTSDVIARFDAVDAPTPAQIRSAYAAAAAGSHLLVAVHRAGSPLVLALEKTAPTAGPPTK